MDVQAIRVSRPADELLFDGVTFADPKVDLPGLRANGGQHMLLVRESRAAELEGLDPVKGFGERHRSGGLHRLLLGKRPKIPLVRAPYTSLARLRQSMKALLGRPEYGRDKNVYLLVLKDDFFDMCWDEYGIPLPGLAALVGGNGGPADAVEVDGSGPKARLAPMARLGEKTPPPASGPSPATGTFDPWEECLARYEVPQFVRDRFIGVSTHVEEIRRHIMLAADSDEPALIFGETGTGKDVVAKLIHFASRRPDDKYFPFNCSAFGSEMLEAELFGANENAASNLAARPGIWRAADGGTLFMDELGELSKPHQAKVLRAVDTNEIRPMGQAESVTVDARLIAATNRDLTQMVRNGEFRQDLFHRFEGFWIEILPLRDRPEDIEPLANWYWDRFTGKRGAPLPPDVIDELSVRAWPGNVREVRGVIDRMARLCAHDYSLVNADYARAAFRFQHLTPDPPSSLSGPLPADLVHYYRQIRLTHLMQLDEVLNRLRRTIKPVVWERELDGADPATVLRRTAHAISESGRLLEKLEEISHQPPSTFPRPESPSQIRHLLTVLRSFYRALKTDPDGATKLWQTTVWGHFKLAIETIHGDVTRLIDGPPAR